MAARRGTGDSKLSTHSKKEESLQSSETKQNVSIGDSGTLDTLKLTIRDGVSGYIFWSVFQALAPMIWFYPLNELEISGYEAFCLCWLSPIICIVPGVFGAIQNRWVLTLLRLITVASVASFQAPTTLSRLIILSVGAGVSMLVLTATLWNPNKAVRYRTYWGLIIGLHAFLASRVWYVTFVPAWWDNFSNTVVVTCGVVASLGYLLEETPTSEDKPDKFTTKDKPSWIVCGLGLGSLIYLTHMCFGEASLVTRWTVKGYPDPGPVPLPWGSFILISLTAGSLLSQRQKMPFLAALAATGCIFFLLFFPEPYPAFAAGSVLAVLTMSLWPAVIDASTQCNPALCLTFACLTYIVQVLFWVWTVAFNFVPYGEHTREHTDWLIGIVMAGILMLTALYNSADNGFTSYYKNKSVPNFSFYAKVIILVFLVGQGGMLKRYLKYKPGPSEKPDSKVFMAGIWTYHFGYDNRGWQSMERAAVMINDTGVDVITLLESDASKPFLGNNDLATWLAERLGFYVDFGPSTKDHTWGNLILSRYPIVTSVHHLLPSPFGELAPAITASINISGTIVDFVVTHMGNDRDVLDRKLQAEYLAKELKNSNNPALFLGYVTSYPGSENYKHLIREGGVKDIDPTDKGRWCEYIMYKKLIRLGYARISHGGLSDTEVQLGTFRIPENRQKFQDNSKVTTAPSKHGIDKDLLFNKKFGTFYKGHGHFDYHGFHMDTPKYFYN